MSSPRWRPNSLSDRSDEWAKFGEYVGGSLGALYALLAFGGVLLTVRHQDKQSRRDLQTARATARAYVKAAGLRWISHLDDKTGRWFWRLHPIWDNVGNTPTRNLRVRVRFDLTDVPLPPDSAFPVDYLPALGRSSLAPHDRMESPFYDITGADLQLVKQEKKHLFVWGGAEYNDVFPGTSAHTTKFCFKAGPVTGNPLHEWDAKKNPLDIRLSHVAGHNFMDEDVLT